MQNCLLFVDLFSNLLLSTYYVPGFGDRVVNKTDIVSHSGNSQNKGTGALNKKINKHLPVVISVLNKKQGNVKKNN